MVEVPISPGQRSVPAVVISSIMLGMLTASRAVYSFVAGEFWIGVALLVLLLVIVVNGIVLIRRWGRGAFLLLWDAPRVRVQIRGKTVLDGGVEEFEAVDEDRQGFFLQVSKRQVFWLQRRDVPWDLGQALETRMAKDRGGFQARFRAGRNSVARTVTWRAERCGRRPRLSSASW